MKYMIEKLFSLIEFKNAIQDGSVNIKEYNHLLCLDIDSFQLYNYVYGHTEGDKRLENIGTILKEIFRSDLVVRVRSDEFIILSMNDIKEKLPIVLKLINDHSVDYTNVSEMRVNVKYFSVSLFYLNNIFLENFECLQRFIDKAFYELGSCKYSSKHKQSVICVSGNDFNTIEVIEN